MYTYKEHFDSPYQDSFFISSNDFGNIVSICFCEIHAEKFNVFFKMIFNIHMIFIQFICILHA